MCKVKIRRLNAADIDIFRAIRLEALLLEPSAYASSAQDWASLTEDEWRNRLRMPVFVAFRAEEPIGIMGLLRQKASKMAHRATLIMVYVRASERGNGVAAQLLEAVITFARQHGVLQVELNVSCDNTRAIRFYRQHGFAKVGVVPAGMMLEGREIDELVMLRRLN